jgi:PAS domain S-box-containing protein
MPTRLSILGVPFAERIFRRQYMLPVAAGIVASLAALEWFLHADFSLGILYVIPIAIAATVTTRIEIVLMAVLCAYIRGVFTPQATQLEYLLRFAMASLAFSGIGLFVVEMSRNRRLVLTYYDNLRFEQALRKQAEDQLRILADSSPAAILTVNHDAQIVAANRSTQELFGYPTREALIGQNVGDFLEVLANAVRLPSGPREVHTSAWTWARRTDGTTIPVAAWFSTYGRGDDRFLAAIVVDVSEEVRDRERENFRHLVDYHKLFAGAVSHEIRNLCSAAAVVCSTLGRRPGLEEDPDFQALSQLIDGLARMASFELHEKASEKAVSASVAAVLDQLRIIIGPDWQDNDGEVRFEIANNLPRVKADPHGLLQIFLNLAQNSHRAVQDSNVKELLIRAERINDDVIVSFIDSGAGISDPSHLFQPFRPNSKGAGLGLYISRTLARSFEGELNYIPGGPGCRFDAKLKVPGKASLRGSSSSQDQPLPVG